MDLQEEIAHGAFAAFIDSTYSHSGAFRPMMIDNTPGNDMLSALRSGLAASREFLFSVSFIRLSGLEMLLQTLKDIGEKGARGRILTTDYLAYTEPAALEKLLSFPFIETRIVTGEAFHAKGYLLSDGRTDTIMIGSSNITGGALRSNREWNLKSIMLRGSALSSEFRESFGKFWDHAVPLDRIWLESYARRYREENESRRAMKESSLESISEIKQNAMQEAAAESLSALRREGKDKALIIAATGTGKTYLAAFDVRAFRPRRMIFIVHREQILREAADSFRDILGSDIEHDIGFLIGNIKSTDKKYIFTTIQTLSKDEVYREFSSDAFDYMIIDEVHKAAAPSYRKILSYFHPEFLLGMSATPDRPDREDIYGIFGYNIAIDIRLRDALEANLLCPFHYFGIADIAVDGKPLEEDADFGDLTSEERVRSILEKSEFYGFSGERVKGLIFCSRTDEARVLAEGISKRKKSSGRNWQAMWITGATPIAEREKYIEQLQKDGGEDILDFIITVDTFNEGIDIPGVNQIIMLRPTESSIIFIQQLGRGLRKNAEGKEFLVVIDFIGNYRKSFLIPAALTGDRSCDKDNLRKSLLEGSSEIPGCSTIDFDPVARELIYRNIDRSDLREMAFLRSEYFALKNRIGRIPWIADFSKEKAIDIQNFVDKAGSYHAFVKRTDREYSITLSEDEERVIRYISEKFSGGRRKGELEFLRNALEGTDAEYEEGRLLDSIGWNLDLSFLQQHERERYGSIALARKEGSRLIPSGQLRAMLGDPSFRSILRDIVEDGLERNSEMYGNTLPGTPFVLYRKYTYEDVCRLLCWRTNMNPLAIGGYFFDRETRTLPFFITYVKDKDAVQYPNRFLDDRTITAYSKKPRKIGCSDYCHIYRTTEEDKENSIFLFVRKSSDDARKEFYFLGLIRAAGEAKPVTIDGKECFEITYLLSTPVRRDILDYILS